MTTTVLYSSNDTFIRTGLTTNQDASADMHIGEINNAVNTYRSLVKFDLSSIPSSAIVSSAILSLYCITDYSSNSRTFRVYRTKRTVVYNQCTWYIYSTGNNWQNEGGFGTDDCEQTDIGSRSMSATETLNVYKDFTLAPGKVQEMISGTFTNNGFFCKADTEENDMYSFNTNNAASNKPKLTIEYTLPTATVRTNRGINLLGRQGRRLVF